MIMLPATLGILRPSGNAVFAYLTSTPYPLIVVESILDNVNTLAGIMWLAPNDSALDGFVGLAGELRVAIKYYPDWPPESANDNGVSTLTGELRSILKAYADWPNESGNDNFIGPLTGSLATVLIQYTNWPAEKVNDNFVSLTGTLA